MLLLTLPPVEYLYLSSGLEEEAEYIITVCVDQQSEKQEHTGYLGIFEELIARLATGNYLIQEEHHMTAIQRRNRQYIHKGQDD